MNVFLDGPRSGNVVALKGVALAGAGAMAPEPDGTPPPPGPKRYVLGDAAGVQHRLAFDDPSGPLPLAPGESVDVTVDTVMGFPSPCGIVVTDAKGLVFAAASDDDVGAAVLKSGVPGFTLRLVPSECPSRPVSKCYTARVNALLEVTRSGQSIRLGQGERALLGDFEITCHIAEHVTYAKGCADAGVFQVSYSIRRVR